jgi:uncharacterized membrane protein YgcG
MVDMKPLDELNPQLQAKLNSIQATQPRDASAAFRGKSRFLAEARKLAVTSTGLERHTKWIDNFKNLFSRKEKVPMFSTIVSVFLILATLLSGSGITVAAAQASQPGDFLYPVKTLSEDAYYQVATGDQNRFDLALDYAERRISEIQNMLENGQVPPEAVKLRLQTHLQTALELSLKNPAEAEKHLEQIRLLLQEQLRTQLQLTLTNPDAEGLRLQIRDMLQDRISWIDEDLGQLTQLHLQTQNQQQTQTAQPENVQGYGNNSSDPNQMQGNQIGNENLAQPGMMTTATPAAVGTQYQNQDGSGSQGSSGSGQGGSGSGQGGSGSGQDK